MDINVELFKKYSPKNKLGMINKLTDKELLSVSESTILRMIREAGSGELRSRFKTLYIARGRRTGNDWNSNIFYISALKGKVYVGFNVDYSNTDTTISESYSTFMKKGDYKGSFVAADDRGNDKTYYFDYSEKDKAKAVRSFLLEYVNTKYADKLKED